MVTTHVAGIRECLGVKLLHGDARVTLSSHAEGSAAPETIEPEVKFAQSLWPSGREAGDGRYTLAAHGQAGLSPQFFDSAIADGPAQRLLSSGKASLSEELRPVPALGGGHGEGLFGSLLPLCFR